MTTRDRPNANNCIVVNRIPLTMREGEIHSLLQDSGLRVKSVQRIKNRHQMDTTLIKVELVDSV